MILSLQYTVGAGLVWMTGWATIDLFWWLAQSLLTWQDSFWRWMLILDIWSWESVWLASWLNVWDIFVENSVRTQLVSRPALLSARLLGPYLTSFSSSLSWWCCSVRLAGTVATTDKRDGLKSVDIDIDSDITASNLLLTQVILMVNMVLLALALVSMVALVAWDPTSGSQASRGSCAWTGGYCLWIGWDNITAL